MALLPLSPAINTAECALSAPTDQRGQPRPALGGCDIGAFEVQPPPFTLHSIEQSDASNLRLTGSGPSAAPFRVRASDNLMDWQTVASGNVGLDGRFTIDVPAHGSPTLFLRTISP